MSKFSYTAQILLTRLRTRLKPNLPRGRGGNQRYIHAGTIYVAMRPVCPLHYWLRVRLAWATANTVVRVLMRRTITSRGDVRRGQEMIIVDPNVQRWPTTSRLGRWPTLANVGQRWNVLECQINRNNANMYDGA